MTYRYNEQTGWKDVIKARISHFQKNYHAHEAGRLTLALKAIEELIPPSSWENKPVDGEDAIGFAEWIRESGYLFLQKRWIKVEDIDWDADTKDLNLLTTAELYKTYKGEGEVKEDGAIVIIQDVLSDHLGNSELHTTLELIADDIHDELKKQFTITRKQSK